ncbi:MULTISPECIES: hypothetical protein [unclassified Streptomyces]|uniref:hypothetical protein n=1 Tax=Streptomyces sp. NPDC055082 TaxID=3365718 RepID=UPI0037D46186
MGADAAQGAQAVGGVDGHGSGEPGGGHDDMGRRSVRLLRPGVAPGKGRGEFVEGFVGGVQGVIEGACRGVVVKCATVMVRFVPFPHASAWPFILTSAALEVLSQLFLLRAYQPGDFGQMYPLARGTAPLLVAFAAVSILGQSLTAVETAGIVAISAGLVGPAFANGWPGRAQLPALAAAMATGAVIAAYTVIDGTGVRHSDHPDRHSRPGTRPPLMWSLGREPMPCTQKALSARTADTHHPPDGKPSHMVSRSTAGAPRGAASVIGRPGRSPSPARAGPQAVAASPGTAIDHTQMRVSRIDLLILPFRSLKWPG